MEIDLSMDVYISLSLSLCLYLSVCVWVCVCVCLYVCVCVCVTYILSNFYLLHFISDPDFLCLPIPVRIPAIIRLRSLPCYTPISVNPLSHVPGVAPSRPFLLCLHKFSHARARAVPSPIHPSALVAAGCAPLCCEGRGGVGC